MPSSLGDRLTAERWRYFVGRVEEQALFQAALAADDFPFFVLYIFGPGGVGKSTLLRIFQDLCEQERMPAALLDGRDIEPSPHGFLTALGWALQLDLSLSPGQALAERRQRQVILVDTFENLTPISDWLRTEFLPQLPEGLLFVLAGRQPPPLAWRADPGWKKIVRVVALRNLSPAEGETYLSRRQIPPDLRRGALAFTHGHPLALSLIADTFDEQPDTGLHFDPTPDVIQTLLEKFVSGISDATQQAALEASALVRFTTEPLLTRLVETGDPRALFRWLQSLSFMEAGREGLFPHDLAREVLAADLRWRNPDLFAELHRRARAFYQERLRGTSGKAQQAVLWDYIFLHRDNAMVKPFFDWELSGGILVGRLQAGEERELETMVMTHEGAESARLASHWMAEQPEGVRVLRDARSQLVGFFLLLDLTRTGPEDRQRDPAVAAAWYALEAHAPLRAGERATLVRFWMGAEEYQAVSPAQSLIFVNVVRHYLTTSGLAFSLFPCADPEFWAAGFAYGDLQRLPEADFELGGRSYGVYGHDWRAVPPVAWLDLLAEREISLDPQPGARPPRRQSMVVLSQEDFSGAIREALRHYRRPEMLRSSPLLQSRLVVERAGFQSDLDERLSVLQDLIADAARSLEATPREQKFYRALQRTYLDPAPTQEKAAEMLDLPFSTYRRHLKAGIGRVTEALWSRELGV